MSLVKNMSKVISLVSEILKSNVINLRPDNPIDIYNKNNLSYNFINHTTIYFGFLTIISFWVMINSGVR